MQGFEDPLGDNEIIQVIIARFPGRQSPLKPLRKTQMVIIETHILMFLIMFISSKATADDVEIIILNSLVWLIVALWHHITSEILVITECRFRSTQRDVVILHTAVALLLTFINFNPSLHK